MDISGGWRLIVVTDSANANAETDAGEANNIEQLAIDIAGDTFADLAVVAIDAPDPLIDDPATLTVNWTVRNLGTGLGRTLNWTDRVIYSANDIEGDGDDIVIGTVEHTGGLDVGADYSASVTYHFGPSFSRHGKLFVRTDAAGTVWKTARKPTTSIRKRSTSCRSPTPTCASNRSVAPAPAYSGRPIDVTWTVANRGIGITSTVTWGDAVWLTENARRHG